MDKKYYKPLAANTEENLELFADNLEKHIRDSEMREGYLRKGRKNEQEVLHCYDKKTNRVVFFNKDTNKFISGWKLDLPYQIDQFLENNNLI